MRCHMRKRTNHKGSSLSLFLIMYLFLQTVHLTCEKHIQGLGKETWRVTLFPSRCCVISFLCVYHNGYVAVAQFLPCWSKGLQAAMHLEGFLVLAIPLFTFLCKPGGSHHLPLSGKPTTKLEYFLISSHSSPSVLGRFPGSPFPSGQETLKLLNSSANSSTLASCWHFSLSLSLIGNSISQQRTLCLNPHLL